MLECPLCGVADKKADAQNVEQCHGWPAQFWNHVQEAMPEEHKTACAPRDSPKIVTVLRPCLSGPEDRAGQLQRSHFPFLRKLNDAAAPAVVARTVPDEPITITLSRNGWIRSRQGHALDATQFLDKRGGAALGV